jgi:hypothetical protein
VERYGLYAHPMNINMAPTTANEEKYFMIFSIWGENTKIWELQV